MPLPQSPQGAPSPSGQPSPARPHFSGSLSNCGSQDHPAEFIIPSLGPAPGFPRPFGTLQVCSENQQCLSVLARPECVFGSECKNKSQVGSTRTKILPPPQLIPAPLPPAQSHTLTHSHFHTHTHHSQHRLPPPTAPSWARPLLHPCGHLCSACCSRSSASLTQTYLEKSPTPNPLSKGRSRRE